MAVSVIIMFGTEEREHRVREVRKKQEWWFTLEPNPLPEMKIWEAKIEGQWWVCDSDGQGNFHIVKYDRKNGRGIDEFGLFKWLSGFGIHSTCVVKLKALGVNKDVKREREALADRLARERWMQENSKK